VLDGRDRPRLAQEALVQIPALEELRLDDLKGDLPPQPSVFREKHHPHAADADRLQDAIACQPAELVGLFRGSQEIVGRQEGRHWHHRRHRRRGRVGSGRRQRLGRILGTQTLEPGHQRLRRRRRQTAWLGPRLAHGRHQHVLGVEPLQRLRAARAGEHVGFQLLGFPRRRLAQQQALQSVPIGAIRFV
jgi:hypothetical protein